MHACGQSDGLISPKKQVRTARLAPTEHAAGTAHARARNGGRCFSEERARRLSELYQPGQSPVRVMTCPPLTKLGSSRTLTVWALARSLANAGE